MKSYLEQVHKAFDEKFTQQVGTHLTAVTPWATLPEIKAFFDEQLKAFVEKLEKVEKEKWDDAEHCSCLRHAIWVAKGEPDEEKV